jgi:3-oxoacyl-[acyl-carrier-protein] synthase II
VAARVAIVAADVETALGAGLAPTLDRLLRGESAVAPVRGFDPAPFRGDAAAQVAAETAVASAEGPTRVLTAHGRILERLARVVHDAARGGDLARDRVGLYVALGMVDSDPAALAPALSASRADDGTFDLARFFAGAFRSIHPHWPLQMLNNVAVGQVAADLDARGDNIVLGPEADAGARAIVEAAEAVRGGVVSLAVVAGIAETVSPAALLRASLRGVPGLVLGEGGGALALEASDAATARGVKALGFLSGTSSAFGPSDVGPGPSAEAIERAARAALAASGASPEDVGLLLVEGGSAEEADARRALFGRRADLAVLAPALGVGHLLAGAPALAVALATGVLALGRAPSGAGGRPRPVPRGARALVLSSGSAGGAAALVVEGAS